MQKLLVRGVLATVLIIVLGLAIERWHVTDEERVEAAWTELVTALQEEDAGRMRARLHPELRYSGARPVGKGDVADAMVALADFWEQVDRVVVATRQIEIQAQPHVATSLATTVLRFSWGDQMAIYRVRVQVAWAADGDSWVARDIDVLEMTPGLFGG